MQIQKLWEVYRKVHQKSTLLASPLQLIPRQLISQKLLRRIRGKPLHGTGINHGVNRIGIGIAQIGANKVGTLHLLIGARHHNGLRGKPLQGMVPDPVTPATQHIKHGTHILATELLLQFVCVPHSRTAHLYIIHACRNREISAYSADMNERQNQADAETINP